MAGEIREVILPAMANQFHVIKESAICQESVSFRLKASERTRVQKDL